MKSKVENLILFVHRFLLTVCMMALSHLSVGDPSATFATANQHYIEQDYAAAILAYGSILKSNEVSPEVYFNLGNAYYKTGDMTRAILNYERAKRLRPSDPDIAHNLRIAYLGTIDKIEPLPKVFYEEWWEKFVNEGSVDRRAIIVVILLWASFLLGSVYLFVNRIGARKAAFFTGTSVLIIGLFTWYLTWLQQSHLNSHKGAIIFTDSAYVKSSPDQKSSNLFMLHSGTRIEVMDELQGWKKIRIANGNEGWIESGSIEII